MRSRVFFAFTRSCSRSLWQNSARVITRIFSPYRTNQEPIKGQRSFRHLLALRCTDR